MKTRSSVAAVVTVAAVVAASACHAARTTQAVAACGEMQTALRTLLGRWEELKDKDVKPLNERLRKAELPLLTPTSR